MKRGKNKAISLASYRSRCRVAIDIGRNDQRAIGLVLEISDPLQLVTRLLAAADIPIGLAV
jgi:hypothetical protein